MKLPFVPLSASGCRWRSPVLHPLAPRVGRDGSPAGSAASFAADTGDSLIPIAETEAPNAQSGNSSLHSSPVLCRTLEDRHYRPTTQHSPRCRAPCLADRLVSSGTGPAPLHYRSLRRVCSVHLTELSPTTGYADFSDGPRSRLHRKRCADAARSGSLPPRANGSVSATVSVFRRA